MKRIRILEYNGPDDWVQNTIAQSPIKAGTVEHFGFRKTIKCTELTEDQVCVIMEEEEDERTGS